MNGVNTNYMQLLKMMRNNADKQEPRQGEATAREQSNLQPQDRGRDNAQRAIDKAASNDPSKAAVERAKASARQVERLRERGEKAAAAARAKADLAQRTQDAAVRKAQQIQKLNEQKASKDGLNNSP